MKNILSKINLLIEFFKYRYLVNNKDRRKIDAYQIKKEKRLKKFLLKKSEYFKQNPHFPIIDKKIMMDNFDEMNTVGITKEGAFKLAINSEKTRNFEQKMNNITVGLSSGTSGHRGLFIVSDKERNKWAGAILAKALPEKKLFNHKVAFFLRADSNLYETVNSKLLNFKYFDIYKNMEQNMIELNEFKPTILVAPPSVLIDIANAVKNKKIEINPIKILSVAEVLEDSDKERFKKIFKQDIIHQVYQCTEGFLGITCKYGILHINEDMIKIEKDYVDSQRFIPIITDLERTSQPIIRYRLNDILVERNTPCKCGSKFLAIEKIEGRTDDIFIFNSSHGEVKVFSDFIRRCILFVENIENYKVTQTSKKTIIIQLDNTNYDIENKITKEFEKLAEDLDFDMPEITFSKYEHSYKKKLKRIERKF